MPHPLALVAVLAAGGAVAAFITARFAPEARGHGVPEVMAAIALHGGKIRPRVIAIKALASATSIGFGGSCGREGPIVQIGSAIGSVLGGAVRAPAPVVRTLVACGAAAGISATFNAPIGGVFFASEVILGDFAPRSFAVIVVASVIAAVVSRAYLGNRPSFDAAGFVLVSPRELICYAVLGVICAFWAWGFVRLLYAIEDVVEKIPLPAPLLGAIGFACVGAIATFAPDVLGVGYDAMQRTLDGHTAAAPAFALAFLKPLATSLTLGSGGSGGVFAPSLFGGAMLGDAYGSVVHAMFPAWTAAGPSVRARRDGRGVCGCGGSTDHRDRHRLRDVGRLHDRLAAHDRDRHLVAARTAITRSDRLRDEAPSSGHRLGCRAQAAAARARARDESRAGRQR